MLFEKPRRVGLISVIPFALVFLGFFVFESSVIGALLVAVGLALSLVRTLWRFRAFSRTATARRRSVRLEGAKN